MNNGTAPAAVEAVSATHGPTATLQALAEAVGALGAAPAAAAGPNEATAQAPTGPAGHAALAAQAQQGRQTLGQLAAEQSALRGSSSEAAAVPRAGIEAGLGAAGTALLRGAAVPDNVAVQHPADTLVLPTQVSALFLPPMLPAQVRPPAVEGQVRRSHDDLLPWHDDSSERESEPTIPDTDTGADADPPAATPDAQALALRELLQRADQTAALAELARGRRLLLVLPQSGAPPVAAVAWLLSATRAQRHGARWWPGLRLAAGGPAPGEAADWLPWRMFRDGDPQLGRGLVSRAAGPACRVRLGAQPPQLHDAAAASLVLPDRIRFAQALGGQWSLLLLAAPAGTVAEV